MHFRMESS